VATVDLSKYGTPEGNAELAQTLINASRSKGFFYVTNFGIPQAEVDKQLALGQRFYELPLEEKLKYEPNLNNGEYNGYRPAGRRLLSGGIKDKTEVWNMASESTTLSAIDLGVLRASPNHIDP
jgi:isopenicillin N synthase-like dioxygenase